MINCWVKALVNFAFGFATASVFFLLAPTKDSSHDNDEELEERLCEIEEELKEIEKEINELAPAVEEENK